MTNKASSTTTKRRYGRLVVIERTGKDRWNAALWRFRCDCGNDNYVARLDQVKRGMIKSCGCLTREMAAERARARTKHGHNRKNSRSSEYRSWQAMLNRCRNPKNVHYDIYGGRGISVCDRWKNSFEDFLFDMGVKPSPEHTIGRIDINGNYEPSNCRWESRKQQARNKSNNRIVTYMGREMSLAEACDLARISRNVVDGRLNRGWPMEKALTTPVKKRPARD